MNDKEWEEKYKNKTSHDEPDIPRLLTENSHLLSGGTALDIAMGIGQNSVFLASHGYNVEGVDFSHSAVLLAGEAAGKRGVSLKAVEKNMLEYEIKENYFDIILNFYFLERSLIPGIHKGLKKNGIVFFETYTVEHADFSKPSNPDFLLKPNELLGFFLDFFIIFYYERTEETRAVASLIAQKV